MKTFLCVVSPKFPENYRIGVVAETWGVESVYKDKIARSSIGDEIVFIADQEIKSIHRIESKVYRDNTPLWPAKNGDLFEYRIKISKPLFSGRLSKSEFVPNISFMRDADAWGGTIMGANGVFNQRLTPADTAFIKSQLRPAATTFKPVDQPALRAAEQPKIQNLFKLIGSDVLESLKRILPSLGLERYNGRDFPAEYDLGYGGNVILCREVGSGILVIVDFNRGEAPSETLLRVLHYMSWVRQHLSNGKDVSGVILTETADENLRSIVNEVPNISLRYYRIGIELVASDRLSA